MTGKLNAIQIEDILSHQFYGHLGCSAKGVTYVVPLTYAYDGENIYAYSFEGEKIQIMRENPVVCFEVEDVKNMGNWRSVIVNGEFKEITDIKEREEAIKKLISRPIPQVSGEKMRFSSDGDWPFSMYNDLQKANGIIFLIHSKEKTGRFESSEGQTMAFG